MANNLVVRTLATGLARSARLTFLLFFGLESACFVPASVGQQMQREIDDLQAALQAAHKGLDKQNAALDEKIAEASSHIDEVNQALQDLNRAARTTDADFGIQMERLIRESQELRGLIELTEYRLAQLEKKLEGEGSLTSRVVELEGETPTDTRPKVLATEVPSDPKEMLQYAGRLLKQKKVAEARGVYREILRKAPRTPGVTDAAYYQLGSIYYDDKKYRNALQELVKVVEKFENGKYADDAYYKIGLCSMDLGNFEDAQIFFGQVVKSYPKSKLVNAARKKLKEVNGKLKAER